MIRQGVHENATVHDSVKIGKNTRIWNLTQVREDVEIGQSCIIGRNVYVDFGVKIGDVVKIQNNALLFHGSVIENGAFIGPAVCLTNDKIPRSVNPDMSLKTGDDWEERGVTIKQGASIGACSVVCPGVTIGEFAMVGAGSVVTKDIPEHAVAYGNPARVHGYVCRCGHDRVNNKRIMKRICDQCARKGAL